MTYRISYEDGWAAATGARHEPVTQTEYFRTEHEALNRAHELLDSGVHHAVAVHDDSGNMLAGIRLQLKLGASAAD